MSPRYFPSGLLLALFAQAALAVTDVEIENSFNPYKSGLPTHPGLTAGTLIHKGNIDQFKDVVDEGIELAIRNGWYEIKVTSTSSFDIERHYVDATRQHAHKVRLTDKAGELQGYAGGRPFPEEPQPADPRAGEKIAWNFRFREGDGGAIMPIQWKYRNMQTGQVERLLRVEANLIKFKYRVHTPPLPEITPNAANLYMATYLKVVEPSDLKNTQLLIQRYDDDAKQDDAYMYYGFQRRVRRLATGQTTDAFLGSDVMIEDFDGYNARVSEMKWTYKGTRNLLMPFYNHDELKLSDEFKDGEGYQYVNFGGQGGCFPDIPWQLRKVYVVEAEPLAPNHPVSKRVFFFDAQTYSIARTQIHDRKGELWKIAILGKSHADHHHPANKGSGIPINDAGAMIDVQARHCSTGQFKALAQPKLSPPSLFQVQNLRAGD